MQARPTINIALHATWQLQSFEFIHSEYTEVAVHQTIVDTTALPITKSVLQVEVVATWV